MILIISVLGCSSDKASLFEPECLCQKIDFKEGISVEDSLGDYSVTTFETWIPRLYLVDNHSQIMMGDSTNGQLRGIGVDMFERTGVWDWKGQVRNMMSSYDVTNYGQIGFHGDSLFWIDVEEFDPYMKTRYITKLIPEKKKVLSISLVTNDSLASNTRLCEMENIIETIELKK